MKNDICTGGAMENITGKAVVADDFLETRLFLVEQLRDLVQRHSVLIEGPRRFGKTSLIQEFKRQEETLGESSAIIVLFLELEGIETLCEFCFRLYRELLTLFDGRRRLDKMATILGDVWNVVASRIGSIDAFEFGVELRTKTRDLDFEGWKQLITPLLAKLSVVERRVVIAFDEFPDMLANFGNGREPLGMKGATDSLTAWLRSLRQETAPFAFIFCGSINLRKTLEDIGLSKRMNDLESLVVPTMNDTESRRMMELLSERYKTNIDPEAIEFLVEKSIKGSPYFGQILFKSLRDTRITEFSLETTKEVYEGMLRSGDHDLAHFHTRIDGYISDPKERACSRAILKHLCAGSLTERELFDGYIEDTVDNYPQFQKVVNRLMFEGYIMRDLLQGGKICFISPLLRDWWACREGIK